MTYSTKPDAISMMLEARRLRAEVVGNLLKNGSCAVRRDGVRMARGAVRTASRAADAFARIFRSAEADYLERSKDTADLERRIRLLRRPDQGMLQCVGR